MDSLKEFLFNLLKSAFTSFDDMSNKSAETLSGNLGEWDYILNTFAEVLKPACLVIIALCAMLEIAQMASKVDVIKWEYGLRAMIKLVLARVALDIAPEFLKACYQQSQSWIAKLGDTTVSSSVLIDELRTPIMDIDGLWNVLGMFLSSFVLILAIKLCGIIIQIIAIGRIFEIYVYLAVSPFPFAFLPLGTGDHGFVGRITSKFIKNFIAVCLQGVMMMIVLKIFGTVMGGIMESLKASAGGSDGVISNAAEITDMIYAMLLSCIALVMAVVKSGSWAKSIIDAQ